MGSASVADMPISARRGVGHAGRGDGMAQITIMPLAADDAVIAALSAMLIEAVAEGAGMSFMHPLTPAAAAAFWADSLARAARGERVVLGAWLEGALLGSVTLILDLPENQPHRAEIAKMVTRRAARGRRIGSALLAAAEAEAASRGRRLIVLDTAADGGAAMFYERNGYTLAGTIPDFALTPHGALTATLVYWKQLPPAAPP